MIDRKEMIRFCIAGSIVTATDFSIYYILFHFFPFNVSKGISFTCAGIVGYLLYKYWIFKNNRASFTEVLRYALINSLALGINVFINHRILKPVARVYFHSFDHCHVINKFIYLCLF